VTSGVRARHVVVVGGGITGLVAAYRLARSSNGMPIDVTLLEASDRLGGKLRTVDVGGMSLESGADSFVVRKPWAVELCKELGLHAQLVIPGASGAFVYGRDRLSPFPRQSAFGIPVSATELLRWPGMSRRGRWRALLDLWKRQSKATEDESIGSLVARRMGTEALDALVAPLLAGLHAGDPYRLSVDATFPEIRAWERAHGSLIRGARASLKGGARASERTEESERRAREAAHAPMFTTVWGGLTRLVETLAAAIGAERIRTGAAVTAIARSGDAFTVNTSSDRFEADAVVVTTPAFDAARLLSDTSPDAAEDLAAIRYASSAVVVLVYPPGTAGRLPEATGFVVSPRAGLSITACTWVSRKWPDDAFEDRAVLRCFVGRAGDEGILGLDDEDVVAKAVEDVERAHPIGPLPSAWRVTRWERAMPQYEVGHVARVARIRSALDRSPGVFAAGSAFDGVGIADCVRQANDVAAQVRSYLYRSARSGGAHPTHEEAVR
jgi:protoporphyrinogen/coproporphyrinogen III oxidase